MLIFSPHQERAGAGDPSLHAFELVVEILDRRADGDRRGAVFLNKVAVAPDAVDRVGVELAHGEEAPFEQPRPPERVTGHIDVIRHRKRLGHVGHDRGALGQADVAVDQSRDLVPRVDGQEFVGLGLAGARADRAVLVIETQFLR